MNDATNQAVTPAQLFDAATAPCHRISAGDTVRLTLLRTPDSVLDVSVALEIWDPAGAQPVNSHESSVETFLFLKGEGTAVSDGVETPVKAGQLLVLPAGSEHRIINTGESRLYAITTMYPDHGFAEMILAGPRAAIDSDDLAVLHATLPGKA